jgi:hypothetical protein
MEPLDEKELRPLLRLWKAPETPSGLRDKVLPPRPSWWRWLITGTIRIPVPVGVAVVAVLAAWIWFSRPTPAPVVQPSASKSIADFQPVPQLEPRIIGKNDESNESPAK